MHVVKVVALIQSQLFCLFGFFFFFTAGPLEHREREVELGKRRKLYSVYDVHDEIGRLICILPKCV